MAPKYARDQPAGFKNHVENIAIVGAGGTIGAFLTRSLISAGKRVTALTRPESTSTLPEGVHAVARVDYTSVPDLTAALQGQDALLITLAVTTADAAATQRALVDAAVAAKVPYIMPNEYGIDATDRTFARETLVGEGALAIRDYIVERSRTAGGVTKFVVLSCSFWYEFSLGGAEERYGFDFKEKRLTKFDDGRTRIVTSTWEQCGRAIAALFSLPRLPADENDKQVTISRWDDDAVLIKSFVVSQEDMFRSVLRVTGDKETDWTVSKEESKPRYDQAVKAMREGDFRNYVKAMYTRVFFPNSGGDYSHKTDNHLLGLPEEDFDECTARAVKMAQQGLLRSYGH